MTGGSLDADRRDFLALAGAGVAASLAPAVEARITQEAGFGPGRSQDFTLGWRFFRGVGTGYEQPSLDDGAWRRVDLPHDWSVEDLPGPPTDKKFGPVDAAAVVGGSQGYTIGGEGWYRKPFRIDPAAKPSRVEICFEGISTVSEVWLNGISLGTHCHAYTPFAFDLTPHLLPGNNLLAVRVRNIGKTSRWYAGSGIYRPVTLDVLTGPARLPRWGVGASTRRLDDSRAEISVGTRCEGMVDGVQLRTRLVSADGRVVGEAKSPASQTVDQRLVVHGARLWSPEAPYLHVLRTELLLGGRIVDALEQPFGIRIVRMDAQTGLTVNGKRYRLRGGAVHHDNGLLGACAYPEAEERKVRLLKARGFTALRSSHNPASKAFRDACDRHGMMLIEEAFDTWHVQKLPEDYHLYFKDHWRDDLAAMVLSARNSPSVIMWSIGNEVPQRATPEGLEISWDLANETHRLDPTRPVTAAIHAFPGRPVAPGPRTARAGEADKAVPAATAFLDVVGYNYKLRDFERDHALYPDRVFYATETYAQDTLDYVQLEDRAPYVIGDFVWTAMDYIGEAGIGASKWQSASAGRPMFFATGFPFYLSNCGDIDLIGHQKPQSFSRDVFWGVSPLEIVVHRPGPEGQVERVSPWGYQDETPRWTWPDSEGRPLSVRVYTVGDRVELRLNGSSIGNRSIGREDRMMAGFTVPYAAGTLEAVAYRNGTELGRKRLHTAGAASALRLRPEAPRSTRGRNGLTYVQIEVVDGSGNLVPDLAKPIVLDVDGPAQLVAFGNANPIATGSLQKSSATTFGGRALAILRSTGRSGTVIVRTRATGLLDGTTTIPIA